MSTGVVPPLTVIDATLVHIDRYILLVGGDNRAENEEEVPFAPIYLYNIDNSRWSILPVKPDNITTNPSDGFVDQNGYFLCPITTQSSVAYNSEKRELIVFFGNPPTNQPIYYVISLSKPLAFQHLQNDLLDVFGKIDF